MAHNPYFNLLRHLASIDGETDSAESRLIKHLGISEHISTTDVEIALRVTEQKEAIHSLQDLPQESKAKLMADFAEVVKRDGLQNKEDWNILADFPTKLGYNEKTLTDLMSSDNSTATSALNQSGTEK